MINADSHFSIGQSHLVNEDYAISGNDPFPYLIIADGCSSSEDTDIGARLLVMGAKEYLLNHTNTSSIPNPNEIGLYAAMKAEAAARITNINVNAIDATLIVAFVKGNTAYVYMYGDGTITYIDINDQVHNVDVNYSHNAPFYPSYLVDKARSEQYRALSAEAYKTVHINNDCRDEGITIPTVIKLPTDILKILMIASDGVSSFVNIESQEIIDMSIATKAFSDFKNTKGDFVKRKVKRVLKTMAKNGIVNGDDISIGAFSF